MIETDTTEESGDELSPDKRRFALLWLRLIGAFIFISITCATALLWFVTVNSQPPENFPTGEAIVVEQGTGVRAITELLASEGVVRSPTLLYYVLTFNHDPSAVKASTYVFSEPLDVYTVAKRLTEGDFDTDLIRFTHFEGERIELLAERAAEVFPSFDKDSFLALASGHEGLLFPDTYFLPLDFTEEQLFELMLETLEERLEPFQSAIAAHPLNQDEIITLASIVEREANTPESMGYVAGIFLNRLEIGMALQADATIEYVLEDPLHQLAPGELAENLREVDSPYNTYLYPGLPPTPIGNPGMTAITAVIKPTPSEYLYYLTDDTGVFHYSETYDQHVMNVNRYLR